MAEREDDRKYGSTGVMRRRQTPVTVVAAGHETPTRVVESGYGLSSTKSHTRRTAPDDSLTRPAVFVDKLVEQCALERISVRLYEAILGKWTDRDAYPGGPTREQLKAISRSELTHFQLLATTLLAFGRDPMADVPAAFVPSVAMLRLHEMVATGGASCSEILHALLLAELADNDGWLLLIELCEALGELELAHRFRIAREEELEHLALVRSWVSAHALAGLTPERA